MPPHGLTHPDKLEELIEDFQKSGWNTDKPDLIGYFWHEDCKIQLISGSHRWLAARYAGIDVPVKVYEYEYIENTRGTDEWLRLLNSK